MSGFRQASCHKRFISSARVIRIKAHGIVSNLADNDQQTKNDEAIDKVAKTAKREQRKTEET
jgi:hypothetical protein